MGNTYNKHTAGHIMETDFYVTSPERTIKQCISDLSSRKVAHKFMDYGYILNNNGILIGVFSIGDLFRHTKETTIEEIMKKRPLHSVSPHSKDEVAAHIAVRKNVKALPVVEKGKMLGVIPPKKILHLIHRSSQEDILHMAGVHKSHMDYEDTMKVPILASVWHRAPWLIIGLFGIMIAAGFISTFEDALHRYMILASFIPVIVYLSGALGAQHVTICVRDLASQGKDLNKMKYFLRQTIIAFFLGIIVSVTAYLIVLLFWRESYIGFVISLALFISVMITNLLALGTTLIIDRLGKDPAYGSGPFATVLSDVTSIMVYLFIATLLLIR